MTSTLARKSAVSETSGRVDDLKVIKGVGPSIEKYLHDAGIFSFAQLAALKPAKVAAQLTEMAGVSAERITRQRWIGQARKLAAQHGESLIKSRKEVAPEDHQRYATFKVELLLDGENNVRRTRVVHIQDGHENVWAGWEASRLVDFVAQRAKLKRQPLSPAPTSELEPARSDKPVASPLQTVEAETKEPISDMRLDVISLWLSNAPFDEQEQSQEPSKRAGAQLGFRLSGMGAYLLLAQQLPYTVQILACESETGQMSVLATEHAQLSQDQMEYESTLEYELPEIGQYQVLGTVTVPGSNLSGIALGPVLTIVP